MPGVPGVVDEVVLPVGPGHDRVVAGTGETGDRAEQSRPIGAELAERPERVVRDRPRNAVARARPRATRVEAVVAAVPADDERSLERVPVVDRAVHGARAFEELPV